ncbi:MAG: hypothetical protein JRN06_11440 [Nitrososphaerota archaeon]|nr:hypothetical protein [Nitrososphaerota archaeon]MDG7024703.1 hypothetical protein [Nitrososphaerota archaeon]
MGRSKEGRNSLGTRIEKFVSVTSDHGGEERQSEGFGQRHFDKSGLVPWMNVGAYRDELQELVNGNRTGLAASSAETTFASRLFP